VMARFNDGAKFVIGSRFMVVLAKVMAGWRDSHFHFQA
jgi:hypothetical protein